MEMKKSELIKLIESLNDEDEVMETLKGIEELANSSIDINKLTIEDFKKVITDNKEIKGYYYGEKDSSNTKAVETWKKNHLQEEIDNAMKSKSNEGKSEFEIKFEEEIAKREALEKQIQMKDLESKYKDTLSEKGLDTRLMKFILSENEDDITKNIDLFSQIISSNTDNKVKERLKDSSYKPPKNEDVTKTMTKEELLSKGYKFMQELKENSPEEYKTIMDN